jgi:hypothetical protein
MPPQAEARITACGITFWQSPAALQIVAAGEQREPTRFPTKSQMHCVVSAPRCLEPAGPDSLRLRSAKGRLPAR